ncbi:Inner spore coat protein D [Evansella caseinilytica]|uniref:Inner spore coat protein D n=1 Tax=Evansella caseinilytica TaxID=1503961 RepID=A0A1H3U806_9BACI|nr:CotD family spore coat protein [Evansella caseinilytica]SDZ58580.1 Inner spore coat protein D [Evansella caseinilytica]
MFSPRPGVPAGAPFAPAAAPVAAPAIAPTAAQFYPPRVTPTRQSVRQFNVDHVVPVVHPSHTTNVITNNWRYYHSFPHSESTVCRTTCQDFICPPRPRC